jgi:hypothetical protein
MKYLQVGRRRFKRDDAVRALHARDGAERNIHFDRRGRPVHRQFDVVVNRFVMIEGDFVAFASGSLLSGRGFGFAVAVRRAAPSGSSKHKIPFARDAPAPNMGSEEEQGKQQTGEDSAHDSTRRISPMPVDAVYSLVPCKMSLREGWGILGIDYQNG